MVLRMLLIFDENLYLLHSNTKIPSFQILRLLPVFYEKAEENKSFPTALSVNTDESRFKVNLTNNEKIMKN